MTKEIVKNGDLYWFDENGNSLVVAGDGKVYLVIDDGSVHYVTNDIRKIYDEEIEDYVIEKMTIPEYIKSIKKAAEVSSVWTTAAVTEPTAAETTFSAPAQIIYQTVYQTPEISVVQTKVTEKSTYTEEEKIEESEYKTDTLSSEAQEAVTAVTECETEGAEAAVSSVSQETGITSENIEETVTTDFSIIKETESYMETAAPVKSNTSDAISFILLA